VHYLFIFVDIKGVVYSGSGDVFDGKLFRTTIGSLLLRIMALKFMGGFYLVGWVK